MQGKPKLSLFAAALSLALVTGNSAQAVLVNWQIDSSQSYVRLNIPDTTLDIEGVNTPVRIRDQNSTAVWSDAGGRRATMQGTIASNVVVGAGASLTSIEFLGAAGTAVDDKMLRPNPADFDPDATDAANPNGSFTTTAQGEVAYGGHIVLPSLLPVLVVPGMFSMSEVEYAMTSSPIALGAPSAPLPGGSSNFGLGSALFAFDGLSVSFAGQLLPDALFDLTLTGANSAAGNIDWLGGQDYQLTYNINAPFELDFGEGAVLSGFFSGVIVATATIPEPATLTMAVIGLASIGLALRRRC